ncbi:hypothetical protein PFICI_11385 [Pestalotiopsis fici W106-1]|uniref:Uncharacterized protein n=1 Tax=Pestalotiopsis fici (strain W106-1 / CGMCC3.15140) TaxID=1229662 RepID=W3WXA0_PESFW|nr:uncharacterized protein PFICI_11385 [Pestalotiopsis fici W106-1]ETS77511.1 hypothetical protein PFICI_11385 [Pestalotiopsis fici W106-1]
MMLTLKQPVHYGYRTVHDLPTPPSTSRPSPPVTIQENPQKPLPPLPRRNSPSTRDMSAPHRGLPLPAMTLPQPNPPPASSHPPGHGPGPGPGPMSHVQQPQSQPPLPPSSGHSLGALPMAPQWQGQGADEPMRTWLVAKAEEEKRKQEEEKTRQETLRLEKRRLEHDMLRTCLDRGVPPPMVPVMFLGMAGGMLPQAALEQAQQYLAQLGHQPQLPPAPGQISPDHMRRDSQSHGYGPYAGSAGVPSTPGSAPQTGGFVPYQGPASPTRARAHTLSVAGAIGRPLGSTLPRLATGELITGPQAGQPQVHGQQLSTSQSETQSPSIYFHHWQPPSSQGVSTQPATPSVDSPRKRKATGPQQAAPPPNTQASRRSPPFGHSSTLANPPQGRRRGHSRQRSDLSSYRSAAGGRGRGDSFGPSRALSPGLGTPVEGVPLESSAQVRTGTHTVSSMLSEQPSPPYTGESRTQQHQQQHDQTGESDRRRSPNSADEQTRTGGAARPASRTRDDE